VSAAPLRGGLTQALDDMRHIKAIFFSLALIVSSVSASAERADLTKYPLTFYGLGPLKIGMPATKLRSAGFRFKVQNFGDINDCAQVIILGQKDVGLMFENGRISRIEIYTKSISTFSGARISNSEEEVKRIYGKRMLIEPHRYDDRGHYLKVFSSDKKSSLVFETDGHLVTEMRAGPGAEYVEGCL
jgi:hypothetical protein